MTTLQPQLPLWTLDTLRGRLVELVVDGGGAWVTSCLELVLEAQLCSEPAAWISSTNSWYNPGDAGLLGVDTSALVVVRVNQARSALRSAERLLRSGAFGLVVLDLGPVPPVTVGALGTLVKLAQSHVAAVVCMTSGADSALGSLVSLRADATRRRMGAGAFEVHVDVTKDKRRGPGWDFRRTYHGSEGLW